jgi:5'-nucleotidase
MKLLCAVVVAALGLAACATARSGSPGRTVTLVSFSDYHSHAVPFYSEGRPDQAGIARAIAYFKAAKSRPDTVIVSGGDMMNLGSPTWSDEYRCAEWPWLNGLVDVMAFGNHDVDYGPDEFRRCLEQVTYPVLGANLVGADGEPVLLAGGKPYLVKEVGGVRLGFFAVAGADFQRLVKKERLPPGTRWTEPLAEARRVVTALREVEKVDAVVFIGHQSHDDDEAMARAVPGIDVILGSHSHHKGELARIPGTGTYSVSPYQYLTYVAEVRLRFEGGKLAEVSGGLVRMDESLPEEPEVKARVARMQRGLEQKHPERFRVLGRAAVELSDANVASGESLIGNWATGVLRQAVGAHVFTTTASSFRGSLPPGEVTVEAFFGAIPYKNTLVTAEVTGEQLSAWMAYSVSRMGADGFSQQSGARYRVRDGKPVELQVLKDPARPEAGYVPVEPAGTYTLATTDFQAFVAQGYRELFATFRNPQRTGKDLHAELMAALKAEPARAELDGRDGGR